ncbi:hypothetical protein GCM10010977_20650 [Citricoccus zhacaiensis]|uniref:Uncharacterized protein n=1 Tax=Citricoccus zhacaiensis TaxID=489142 RepID=A0ABQ2M2W1_9MICC|nr:hypothetical protein GCM10010977_20650 [Citricoccus zhacaiensis]
MSGRLTVAANAGVVEAETAVPNAMTPPRAAVPCSSRRRDKRDTRDKRAGREGPGTAAGADADAAAAAAVGEGVDAGVDAAAGTGAVMWSVTSGSIQDGSPSRGGLPGKHARDGPLVVVDLRRCPHRTHVIYVKPRRNADAGPVLLGIGSVLPACPAAPASSSWPSLPARARTGDG